MIHVLPFDPRFVDQILPIAREIAAKSIYWDMPIDEDKLIRHFEVAGNERDPDRWFRLAVDGDTADVLGAFYGMLIRTYLGATPMVRDIGQWTRRDGRQRNAHALLLAEFEAWGREKGATKCSIGFSVAEVEKIETMRRIAEYHGYRVTGYNLVKDI